MTRAEQIRKMDDAQLADYLCYITGSRCGECRFGECEAREECAAMRYLHEETKEEEKR